MKNKHIIIVGHSLIDANGFAYVAFLMIKKFLELKYNITYMNVSKIVVEPKHLESFGFPSTINIVNADVYNGKNTKVFEDYVKENPVDIVLTAHDPWILDHVIYSVYRNTFFWVAYQTFEANLYPDNVLAPTAIHPYKDKYKSIKNILKSCDLVIPCAKIGVEVLANYGIEQNKFIYLGLENLPSVKQVEEMKAIPKQSIFGPQVNEDTFIFMIVGVNNQRKKVDRTVTAFAKFLEGVEDKTKYKLYLHSQLHRNFNGADIIEIIRMLNIKENVIIDTQEVSKNVLYSRYAVVDCFISLYGAEGFGLPFVEALLFDKPVVFTNYSAPAEYCKDYGLAVDCQSYIYTPNIGLQIAIADIEDASTKMKMISDNPTKYNSGSYEYVKKNFNWDINFKEIHKLILDKYIIWNNKENRLKFPIRRIV